MKERKIICRKCPRYSFWDIPARNLILNFFKHKNDSSGTKWKMKFIIVKANNLEKIKILAGSIEKCLDN